MSVGSLPAEPLVVYGRIGDASASRIFPNLTLIGPDSGRSDDQMRFHQMEMFLGAITLDGG